MAAVVGTAQRSVARRAAAGARAVPAARPRQGPLSLSPSTAAAVLPWRGIRAASVGVETLAPPTYMKVPILKEEPTAVLSEMPELALSGPRPYRGPAVRSSSPYASLALDTPIDVPEAKVPSLGDPAAVLQGPATRFAELANGVRVAAVDRQGMCTSLGLFVHAGSRYESAEMACIPHALELMAFRSSAHLSHLRTLKTLEQLGAAASCRVGREDILYQFDTLREYVPVVLPLMLANVLCPSILDEEVTAAREQALETRQGLEENIEGLLCEELHVAAYRGNTLGNPLYATEQDLPKFTAENLRDYIKRECRPERFVIVGVNADFDDLCKWGARCFAEHAVNGTPANGLTGPRKLEPAVYTGGDVRLDRPNPLCHLMLGWEVKGGWNGPMLAAVTVLQMFLGGGGSFSTGGPGKGMHTRLYTEVLNRHHWVESCQASSVMYTDSGLFTVYATVVPAHAEDFIHVIARIFQGLTRIAPAELKRAKNALKSSIHMNLEMRGVMMEDIGRQLVLSGKVGTAQEFGKMVDAVTAADLLECLRTCLRCEPTVVAYGAIEKVPSYDKIKKLLQASAGTT